MVDFVMNESRTYRTNAVHQREILWNLIVAACAFFLAISIPLEVVAARYRDAAWSTLEILSLVILVADPIVKLMGLRQRGGDHFQRYLRYFLVADLLALVVLFMPPDSWYRLAVLFKTVSVFAFLHQWRLHLFRWSGILRSAQFAYILTVVIHVVACGWIALGGSGTQGDSPYLHALYWSVTTMCTVGYGDLTPTNDAQMIYATGVMIIGYIFFAWLIGNIASILNRVDPIHQEHTQTMERVNSFMKFHRIPEPLQRRIADYLTYMWDRKVGSDEPNVLRHLPWGLRSEVSMILRRDLLERVPFLRDASASLLREIADSGRQIVITSGEYVFRAGDAPRYMYFISQGAVEAVDPSGRVLGTLGVGEFFGEMALLEKRRRGASIRATEHCDLFVIDARSFDHIIDTFPEFRTVIQNVARERAASTSELVRSIQ